MSMNGHRDILVVDVQRLSINDYLFSQHQRLKKQTFQQWWSQKEGIPLTETGPKTTNDVSTLETQTYTFNAAKIIQTK
jgi:hypothetical protein